MASRFHVAANPRDLYPGLSLPVSRLLARTRLALADLHLSVAQARIRHKMEDRDKVGVWWGRGGTWDRYKVGGCGGEGGHSLVDRGLWVCEWGSRGREVHPTPYTLHPTPYTLHPTPYTLHLAPYTLHPPPCTLHPTPYTLHIAHCTLHPTPYTLHPTPCTLHPTPHTLHSIPHTPHPAPCTPHPTPYTVMHYPPPSTSSPHSPAPSSQSSLTRSLLSSWTSLTHWRRRWSLRGSPHPTWRWCWQVGAGGGLGAHTA